MKCQHCGVIHEAKCPLVKAIEYYPDGAVKRFEYVTPADHLAPHTGGWFLPTPPREDPRDHLVFKTAGGPFCGTWGL